MELHETQNRSILLVRKKSQLAFAPFLREEGEVFSRHSTQDWKQHMNAPQMIFFFLLQQFSCKGKKNSEYQCVVDIDFKS